MHGRVARCRGTLALAMAKKRASSNPVVGLVQMSCDEKPDRNLKKAHRADREAAKQGATVVCLQELFRSQYFCQKEDAALFALAEPIPGPTTEALARVARAAQGRDRRVALRAARRRPLSQHRRRSSSATDRSAGMYRKMHIPDDPLYYEKFYFTPGDLGFRTHDTSAGKCGVLVCWDQWFPEGARLTALSGAQMLFYPTAIGWLAEEKAGDRTWPSTTPGRRSSAPTPSPTASTSSPSTASGREGAADVLGPVVRRRSLRPHRRQGVERPRRDAGRRDRSRAHRGDPAELAVPARSPHRHVPMASRRGSSTPRRPPMSDAPRLASPRGSRAGTSALRRLPPRLPHAAGVASARGHLARWPKDPLTWPDRVPQVEAIFLRMIEVLAEHEASTCWSTTRRPRRASRRAAWPWPQAANVRLHRVRTVDSWIRDYGPNFLSAVADGGGRRCGAGLQRLGLQRLGRQVPDADGR